MRIGLPRALLYYRYGRFWECFLKGLGAEVVVSRKTDESLLNKGVGCVSSEVCLPIKIVAGHLLELAGEVDAIFFPRIVWMQEKLYACPKMIGIVDIARMLIGDRVRLIAPAIKGNFVTAHLIAGLKINPNPIVVWQAFQQAKKKLSESRSQKHAPSDQTRIGHFGRQGGAEGPKQVGLIGHFYNIQEDFISRAIIETFKENGYQIITKEELPQNVLLNKKGFASKIRWVYERELYNA
ncbi:MAG: acyl-CoA dehydratase activase-related protein, partial [candidate division WOR-3 bacterium]